MRRPGPLRRAAVLAVYRGSGLAGAPGGRPRPA